LNKISDDGDNILVPSFSPRDKEPKAFPKALLDQINALGGMYHLDEALWFYNVTKGAEDARWVTGQDLVGMDTRKYDVHYYQSNWEDSAWDTYSNAITFLQDAPDPRSQDDRAYIQAFFGYDEDGEYIFGDWSLGSHSEVLLVSVSDEEIARREAYAAERKIQDEKDRIAYEQSDESKILSNLFPKKD